MRQSNFQSSTLNRHLIIFGLLLPLALNLLFFSQTFAADCVKTNFFGDCVNAKDTIFVVLRVVLDVLTFGVGVLATLGIAITGITYLTAHDNEQQVAKAKMRLFQIIIGVAAYAILWLFLQWILPGGVFGENMS